MALYIKRLGYVFVANGIMEEAKKEAVFFLVIVASAYKLFSRPTTSLETKHTPSSFIKLLNILLLLPLR